LKVLKKTVFVDKLCQQSILFTESYIYIPVITETGKSTKAYTELCGRTEVLVTDVITALIDQGML
jgi:hypothetical protein